MEIYKPTWKILNSVKSLGGMDGRFSGNFCHSKYTSPNYARVSLLPCVRALL